VRWVNRKIILAAAASCLLIQSFGAPRVLGQPAKKALSAKEEFAVGRLYFSTDDFPQAIEHFNNAIKEDSNDGELYFERGHAYYKLDQYIQAIPDYTRSLQLKYKPAINYERRAYCYLNSKQYKKGISDCTEAIENDPLSRIAYFNRSKAYAIIGESEKSTQDKAKIKELDKRPRVKDLCDACQATRDNDERLKLASAAVKLDPKYPLAMLLLGATYLELDNKKQALTCFDKLVALEPDNLTAYIDRGLCRLETGSFESGIKDLSLVLEHAPECYKAYYWRGECYLSLQQAKTGLADFKKAIEIMQGKMATAYARKNADYRKNLGIFLVSSFSASAHAYEKLGDLPKAIENMTYAVNESRLAPNSLAELLPERAELYKKAGRTEEMHRDLLSAKAVSDKLEAIRRGPYIPPPPMRSSKGDKARQDAPTKPQLPD
jgi:tetratricopeptide (TPR) repeat protein